MNLCSYELDRDLRLVSVDEGWTRFAIENEAPELQPPAVIGTPVIDSMSDPTTKLIYRELFNRTSARSVPITFWIRCDSPRLRRMLELTIVPLEDGGFRIDSVLQRVDPNPGGELLEKHWPRDPSALLRSCSWCKKVNVNNRWYEVEQAVPLLRLFERRQAPLMTHGMCTECHQRMRALLDEEERP